MSPTHTSNPHDASASPLRSLGRIGLWTRALDLQPSTRAREVAAELEELGLSRNGDVLGCTDGRTSP